MNFNRTLTALAAVAVLSLSAGAATAASFPDFTIDPDRDVNTLNSFIADKITGNYVEVITFGANNSFTYALRWVAGQFVANDGVTALPSGGPFSPGTGLGSDYGLYALVTGSGTFSTSGVVTTFNTNAGGTVRFFYDRFSDGVTSFTNLTPNTEATLFARTGDAADVSLLQAGEALSGSGMLDPGLSTCGGVNGGGINCGSFGQTSSIALNAAGRSFFTFPIPFYNAVFNSGQLNNFDIGGVQLINGSMDLVFNRSTVPEPGTIALVGLALAGLGLARRRKV